MPQLLRIARVVLGVTAACTLAGAAASVPVTAVFVLAGVIYVLGLIATMTNTVRDYIAAKLGGGGK